MTQICQALRERQSAELSASEAGVGRAELKHQTKVEKAEAAEQRATDIFDMKVARLEDSIGSMQATET